MEDSTWPSGRPDDMTASFSEQPTCRICRAEGTQDEPLFHPCRCSGSIRHVHQECLVEWLSHSQKKHCELCKTPFRFTKLYDAHMPENLPWGVFLRRGFWDICSMIFSILRTSLVALVWLIVLPWIIRWAWRWMFWFADAGWAREEYMRRESNSTLLEMPRTSWTMKIYEDLRELREGGNTTAMHMAVGLVSNFVNTFSFESLANSTYEEEAWKRPDTSIFSSVSYMSSLTQYPAINRVILDIAEGQLITCTVILSFILIFLIREWVVQQQPLINQEHHADHLAPAQALQGVDDRYRVAAERLADLRADLDAGLEHLNAAQERVRASIEEARRPGMPSREESSLATHIRRDLEEIALRPEPEAVDPKPITNAGADARVFIKWWKGVPPIAVKPLADDDPALLTNEQLEARLDDEADAAAAEANEEFESASETANNEPTPDEERPAHFEGEEAIEVARLPIKQTLFEKVCDWFWTGIEADDTQVVVIDEQRLGLGNEAPFVPVHHHEEHDDPEVDREVAAAAGDQDLGDAAEEMEGLLELIGIRGPIVGMIQTSLFCLLLVASTVMAAVVFPYVWGKIVLSFLGSPIHFLVIMPLKTMSFLADLIVDATLLFGGWILSITAVATEALLASLSTIWPRVGGLNSFAARMSNAALTEASASGQRLQTMFARSDPAMFNTGFLDASANAHIALNEMTAEINALLNMTASTLQKGAHMAATRDLASVRAGAQQVFQQLPELPGQIKLYSEAAYASARHVVDGLRAGTLTLPSHVPPDSFDADLIYWNSFDRSIAVAAGYLALAALAAVYVASDFSFTSSPAGRKIEKAVRDSLAQAGGVVKVILIISIEMLVFPFYCGLLLDFAFLPLFNNSTLSTRLAFAMSHPYLFSFIHWFLGTYYMFHFALFVGMCRKILRKGVLWFIRDPDDPDFHPVRDVLERNVTKQLRKLAFSALVYGALVILCLGGVIWSIGKLFKGVFPIVWRDTEPLLEFPLDLLLYNFLTPVVIAFAKPSEGLQAAYAWWLRRCARGLRLSHFLFGQRMQDEEGVYAYPTWTSMSRLPILQMEDGSIKTTDDNGSFARDGRYVLTPSHDQYRHPKPNEVFLSRTRDNDVEVVDQDGRKHPHWSKVYLPPHFKARIMLFMVCLYIFSAFAGLCVTLVPLTFGRRVLAFALPGTVVNDIYAYTIGIYTLGGALLLVVKSGSAMEIPAVKSAAEEVNKAVRDVQDTAVRAAKCIYVYGYIFVLQPILLTALIELYLFIPLHTFFGMKRQADLSTATVIEANTDPISTKVWLQGLALQDYTIVPHSVHLAQDVALAVLLIHLFFRYILSRPARRAYVAIQQAIEDGMLNPDIHIATRYYIAPSLVMSLFFLVAPVVGATLTTLILRRADITTSTTFETLIFRFSFAAFEAILICINELFLWSAATLRWRARIRDEVYLVGERLHNFGEKRPPAGTKSILRRERGAA